MTKHEGYVQEVSRKTKAFPSEQSMALFTLLCKGIDKARNEEYRWEYQLSGKSVTIVDYGE